MDADFSVELGADDDALEFPWTTEDESLRYYDLKRQPELLLEIREARDWPELGALLESVNVGKSAFVTAKCDVWSDGELSEAEEIYGASLKLASYVDVLFDEAHGERRFNFEEHERLARRVCELLSGAPEIPAAAEFTIRRCYFHDAGEPVAPGFYVTCYLFGYGDDEAEARQRWAIGLSLMQNALVQVSGEMRQGS
jgi:hypothetical protein